jgi:hypothetical protein
MADGSAAPAKNRMDGGSELDHVVSLPPSLLAGGDSLVPHAVLARGFGDPCDAAIANGLSSLPKRLVVLHGFNDFAPTALRLTLSD